MTFARWRWLFKTDDDGGLCGATVAIADDVINGAPLPSHCSLGSVSQSDTTATST